jgi:hypothetical protein
MSALLKTNAENLNQMHDLVPLLSKKFCMVTSAELNVLLKKHVAAVRVQKSEPVDVSALVL